MDNKYHSGHFGGDKDEPEHVNSGGFVQNRSSGLVLITGDWPGSSLCICEMSHFLPTRTQEPVWFDQLTPHPCPPSAPGSGHSLAVANARGNIYPVNVICVHSN